MTAPILLTGASGALGRQLTRILGEAGYTLRLTDIAPFPDALPPRAVFTQADLIDAPAITALADGCSTILHFGGISTEHPFDVVLGPNIVGLHNIYEAARKAKARVVFASSNHAIGFHPRSNKLDADCALRPDSFYGLSKAYGELMGGMYWEKHGVESVSVRIGSSFPEPADVRMLSTWLSYADLGRLMVCCIVAPKTGCCIVWGNSANAATYWGDDARADLGWVPQDTADIFAGKVAGKVTDDPVVERHQGGGYCAMDYTRAR
ncbi:NAD(P)-dependent oxidoreductase [Acidisphaera sp. L21]|uniref:NAD-dependent epimerase/dehydratase family protein n=1 Tax=Acidisphaera sp. L21 TaxID=1641851 RepID=UPI00131C4B8F|nr:NAD(P)-dependent oxidoreductase [Acidisphaera sp. L21]